MNENISMIELTGKRKRERGRGELERERERKWEKKRNIYMKRENCGTFPYFNFRPLKSSPDFSTTKKIRVGWMFFFISNFYPLQGLNPVRPYMQSVDTA